MLANCPFNPQCVFITGIPKRSLLSNTYATQLRTKTRSRYDQASSGNNESRYHQAAPAEYDFPVFPVVSEASLKKFVNIKKLRKTQKLYLKKKKNSH